MKNAVLMAAVWIGLTTGPHATAQDYFNGFETDTAGWDVFGGPFDAVRMPDGSFGIPSASGDWHATGDTPATNWGGYNSTFPTGGYLTSVDVFLDVDAGFANDTRLDFSSAISQPDGTHRRDYVFNLGFYDSTDVTGPGAGSNRFVISASNNATRASSFPKNPAKFPIAIQSTGWHTFEHLFTDDGSGILQVQMSVLDASGNIVNTWVMSDSSDVIGVTVGGNRYGWFVSNELGPELAFDNSFRSSDSDGDGIPDGSDACPNSDFSEFVDTGSGNTSIPNSLIGADEFGCTIQDYVNECAATASNHGQYVSCIVQLANGLYQQGTITKQQRKEMKTGAARSDVGK
jgi:hypothetical protein